MSIPAPIRLVVKIDSQRRFELDPSLLLATLGLKMEKGTTARLWAIIGSEGQLLILPVDDPVVKARDTAGEEGGSEPSWQSANDESTGFTRKLASLLQISCSSEDKRRKLRLTVEADAKSLGLIKIPGEIVVFAAGTLLEIWQTEDWKRVCRVTDPREFEAAIVSE